MSTRNPREVHGDENHFSHRCPKPRCWWLWSDRAESDLIIHLRWSSFPFIVPKQACNRKAIFAPSVCNQRKNTNRGTSFGRLSLCSHFQPQRYRSWACKLRKNCSRNETSETVKGKPWNSCNSQSCFKVQESAAPSLLRPSARFESESIHSNHTAMF